MMVEPTIPKKPKRIPETVEITSSQQTLTGETLETSSYDRRTGEHIEGVTKFYTTNSLTQDEMSEWSDNIRFSVFSWSQAKYQVVDNDEDVCIADIEVCSNTIIVNVTEFTTEEHLEYLFEKFEKFDGVEICGKKVEDYVNDEVTVNGQIP